MASVLVYELNRALAYMAKFRPRPTRELIAAEAGVAGIPAQPSIGPWVGDLLEMLIMTKRPRKILEIGTAAGYGSLVMGKAAQKYGGKITTIEINDALARKAREHLKSVGLEKTVRVINKDAREAIPELKGRFGLILQDGDKSLYSALLPQLLDSLEPNGILVSDDVLLPIMSTYSPNEEWNKAVELYNHELARHPRLKTAWLPVGDGVAVSTKV